MYSCYGNLTQERVAYSNIFWFKIIRRCMKWAVLVFVAFRLSVHLLCSYVV